MRRLVSTFCATRELHRERGLPWVSGDRKTEMKERTRKEKRADILSGRLAENVLHSREQRELSLRATARVLPLLKNQRHPALPLPALFSLIPNVLSENLNGCHPPLKTNVPPPPSAGLPFFFQRPFAAGSERSVPRVLRTVLKVASPLLEQLRCSSARLLPCSSASFFYFRKRDVWTFVNVISHLFFFFFPRLPFFLTLSFSRFLSLLSPIRTNKSQHLFRLRPLPFTPFPFP